MDTIRTLRIGAKIFSLFWGGIGVFWSYRFLALAPTDPAYGLLPLMAACFLAAFVLLGAARVLPQPAARGRRGRGWRTRLLTWAEDL